LDQEIDGGSRLVYLRDQHSSCRSNRKAPTSDFAAGWHCAVPASTRVRTAMHRRALRAKLQKRRIRHYLVPAPVPSWTMPCKGSAPEPVRRSGGSSCQSLLQHWLVGFSYCTPAPPASGGTATRDVRAEGRGRACRNTSLGMRCLS